MSSSPVAFLARRFLISRSSDGFLSFIAWVSVVGVALGVLALVVVTSVINGFEGELIHVITGMNGDVVLYSRADPIMDAKKVEEKIRRAVPETVAVTASFISELMAAGPTSVAGVVVEGLDLSTVGDVTVIPQRIISGRLPQADDEVVLTSALAEKLGVQIGNEIRLIAPFVGEGGAESPKALRVGVVGIARMGMYEYDSKFVFTTLQGMQHFLDQPGKVTSFKLRLAPGTDARKASDKLSENFGYPFRAKDWGQLNKNLLYAIQLEKAVIAIILTIIVIVAAFNVVSTLMMMIHDKTREIAILKAMGFKPSQSFRLFCWVGMGIGTVGTGAGILLGLGANEILSRFKFIELPADIYYIGYLPVVTHWHEIFWIGGLALAITFAATLYPALKVSNRSPLDGLRYD